MRNFKFNNSFLDSLSFSRYIQNGAMIAQEDKHSAALSSFIVFYFSELASYMAFILLKPEGADCQPMISFNFALFGGTLFGGIRASYNLAKGATIKSILIESIKIYLIGTSIFFLLSILETMGFASANSLFFKYLALICYALFGVGFSGTIGLVVAMITENFPRYNRSFSVGVVNFDGFISPILIAGLVWFLGENEYKSVIVLGICIVLGLLSLSYSDKFPKDIASKSVHTTRSEWLSWFGINFSAEKKTNNARAFWNAAFSGLSFTFFFFLFTNISFLSYFQGIKNYHIIFFGYIGLASGSLFWTWRSKIMASRKLIILQSNLLQLCVIVLLMCLRHSNIHYGISFGLLSFAPIAVLLGFSCSWSVVLLQASENFLYHQRGSLMVLIPNFYRCFSILLFSALYLVGEGQLRFFDDRDQWFLLLVAVVLLLVATVSTFGMKDRFGVDATALDVDDDKSLISTNLREELNKIDVVANNKVQYLEEANRILSKHFKQENSIGRLFYMCSIYHRNKDQTKITSPNLMQHLQLFNEQIYAEKAIEKNLEKVAFTHIIGDRLIEIGYLQSTSWWIANDEELNGMLIWNSGPTQRLRDNDNPNKNKHNNDKKKVIVIDLQDIFIPIKEILPASFADINWKKLLEVEKILDEKNEVWRDANGIGIWYNHLESLKSEATFRGNLGDLLKEWQINKHFQKDFDIEKFKLALIHFKIDAMLYKKSEYFRYCIKPYSKKQEVVTLMTIKTTSALPKKRIGQLRDLMSVLMLEKSRYIIDKQNAALLAANNSMAYEEEHYKKHEIFTIKERLVGLAKDFPEIQSQMKYIYVKNGIDHLLNVASLYMTMMKSENAANSSQFINVQDVLSKKLRIVLDSLDLLDLNKAGQMEAVVAKKGEFLHAVAMFSNTIHVKFDETAFGIIVQEFIKNAIKYANPNNPFFDIRWIKTPYECRLEFVNNANISNEQLDFINDENPKITEKNFVSGGIRSVKRIINYFKTSTGWSLRARRTGDNNGVIFVIAIPNSVENIKYETPMNVANANNF